MKEEERLKKLREKRDQLAAQVRVLEDRQKERERKLDTRRKIIAGALALEHAEKDEAFGQTLARLLHRYVERKGDRELFDLPPKGEDLPTPAPAAPAETE